MLFPEIGLGLGLYIVHDMHIQYAFEHMYPIGGKHQVPFRNHNATLPRTQQQFNFQRNKKREQKIYQFNSLFLMPFRIMIYHILFIWSEVYEGATSMGL